MIEKFGFIYVWAVSVLVVTARLFFDQIIGRGAKVDFKTVFIIAVLSAAFTLMGKILDRLGYLFCVFMDWTEQNDLFRIHSWLG